MAGVQKCKFGFTKVSPCVDQPGVDLAARWFGATTESIEAGCGRFAKGRNKGLLRGWIVYRKVDVGGWLFAGYTGAGGVYRPGMIFAIFCRTYDDLCKAQNMTPGEFINASKRVDTAYGHDPLAPAVATAPAPELPASDQTADSEAFKTFVNEVISKL